MNKIIIIEDDIAICNMIKKFLENNKYSVQYALNGIEGIHLCKSFVPDLIILDIMLPGLNGDDVLQKLRKFTNAPVIVVSAKTMVQTKIELLKMGADDYMTKPFDLYELLARIEANLKRTVDNPYQNNYIEVSITHEGVFKIKNSTQSLDDIDMKLLFSKFYTADKSRTKGGSGLGLYIVKELLEKINGKIENISYKDNFLYITIRFSLY